MGIVPLWSVKDVLCSIFTRTSAPRVSSWGRTSQELLEGSLGGRTLLEGLLHRAMHVINLGE